MHCSNTEHSMGFSVTQTQRKEILLDECLDDELHKLVTRNCILPSGLLSSPDQEYSDWSSREIFQPNVIIFSIGTDSLRSLNQTMLEKFRTYCGLLNENRSTTSIRLNKLLQNTLELQGYRQSNDDRDCDRFRWSTTPRLISDYNRSKRAKLLGMLKRIELLESVNQKRELQDTAAALSVTSLHRNSFTEPQKALLDDIVREQGNTSHIELTHLAAFLHIPRLQLQRYFECKAEERRVFREVDASKFAYAQAAYGLDGRQAYTMPTSAGPAIIRSQHDSWQQQKKQELLEQLLVKEAFRLRAVEISSCIVNYDSDRTKLARW